ncbi:transposable element Tcb2 transposase [Trichonephila clavipes]|nr:transposable element Tcb2 transposase [Trichonephila clavipes]
MDKYPRHVLIWRKLGSRHRLSNIVEKDHYGQYRLKRHHDSGHTDLNVLDKGTLTGRGDRNEILAPYVRLFRDEYGPNSILMDDDTRKHRAQLVDDYLRSEDI